jgi:hypothetical protein
MIASKEGKEDIVRRLLQHQKINIYYSHSGGKVIINVM